MLMDIISHYQHFLKTAWNVQVNGCQKGWYGKLKAHKELLAQGKELPPWKEVSIRCHDFRVDFCTRAYEAGIPLKTLQHWMGHENTDMEVLFVKGKLHLFSKINNTAKSLSEKNIFSVFILLLIV